jgi:hypothetical protein
MSLVLRTPSGPSAAEVLGTLEPIGIWTPRKEQEMEMMELRNKAGDEGMMMEDGAEDRLVEACRGH